MFKPVPHFNDRMLSIDELCRGYGVNVVETLKLCKQRRLEHWYARKGFSTKRTKRAICEIPVEIRINPMSPYRHYFDPKQDAHEKKKSLHEFLKRHPEFMVVDSL